MKSESCNSKTLKNLKDKCNPLDKINNLHSLMKKIMKSHGGYDRKYMQDWLNLMWFIFNGPRDKMDKVTLFVNLAISGKKRVKYRDAMAKKVRLNLCFQSPQCKCGFI